MSWRERQNCESTCWQWMKKKKKKEKMNVKFFHIIKLSERGQQSLYRAMHTHTYIHIPRVITADPEAATCNFDEFVSSAFRVLFWYITTLNEMLSGIQLVVWIYYYLCLCSGANWSDAKLILNCELFSTFRQRELVLTTSSMHVLHHLFLSSHMNASSSHNFACFCEFIFQII